MKKRNKYILSLILSFILAVTFCFQINATENNTHGTNELINKKNSSYSAYNQQIETIMTSLVNEKELHNSSNTRNLHNDTDIVKTYDLSNAYRVYITESLFLTELNKTGSFEKALTDKIQWKVPIVTQEDNLGLVTLNENDGVLSWSANEVGESSQIFYITDKKIKTAVQNATKITGDLNDMKIAHSYMYYTTFVYLKNSKEEYLIPFSCYPDEIGINNGELYTVSEIQSKFNKCFDEEKLIENGDANSGLPFRKHTHYFEMTLINIGLAIVAITLIFIIKRKKKA